MVTVFSAPNYMGEFDNAGGILVVDETKTCSFKILKPDGPPLDASVFTPLWAPKADIAGPPEPTEPTEELSQMSISAAAPADAGKATRLPHSPTAL